MNDSAPCLEETFPTRPSDRPTRSVAEVSARSTRTRRPRRSSRLARRSREALKLAGDSLVFLFLLGSTMGTLWGLSLL